MNDFSSAAPTGDFPHDFDRLWTPYRMHYTKSDRSRSGQTFVDLPTLPDKEALIIARGHYVYLVMNLFPYNPGHCMVVPYRQVSEIENLTEEESLELMQFTQKAVRVIKHVSHPHAFNIGFNLGHAAGGSISEHLHQHIVPRWIGDSSFITVLSDTKILVQLLGQTRDLLAQAWEEKSC